MQNQTFIYYSWAESGRLGRTWPMVGLFPYFVFPFSSKTVTLGKKPKAKNEKSVYNSSNKKLHPIKQDVGQAEPGTVCHG